MNKNDSLKDKKILSLKHTPNTFEKNEELCLNIDMISHIQQKLNEIQIELKEIRKENEELKKNAIKMSNHIDYINNLANKIGFTKIFKFFNS